MYNYYYFLDNGEIISLTQYSHINNIYIYIYFHFECFWMLHFFSKIGNNHTKHLHIFLSLVKQCFNRESKTYLCTSDKAVFFSNKKYDIYMLDLH